MAGFEKAYVGVNNIPKEIKQIFVGVNGIPREVSKIYWGNANNIPQLIYATQEKLTMISVLFNWWDSANNISGGDWENRLVFDSDGLNTDSATIQLAVGKAYTLQYYDNEISNYMRVDAELIYYTGDDLSSGYMEWAFGSLGENYADISFSVGEDLKEVSIYIQE